MDARTGRVAAAARVLHSHFLWLLIGAYALAALAPGAGRWLARHAAEGSVLGQDYRAPAPAVMLAVLLFAAGLAAKGEHLRGVFRRPGPLLVGLAATILVPVLVLLLAGPLLALWHEPTDARDVLLGLAVVAAMPVAGSSAGWARAANGDCALSLGLVLLSTILSPLTTPLAFRAAALVCPTGSDGALPGLEGVGGAGVFLTDWVLVPMALGLAGRWAVGVRRAEAVGPPMRVVTSVVLLGLCYTNATACLPLALASPDWDFLALVAVAAGLMCASSFAAGFASARCVCADPARRAALVFGIGMANNGAGLALAAGALAGCPLALLPVVAVNLVQHLGAGWADARLRRA
jgi:BASS family bile acid:Na+ symporter